MFFRLHLEVHTPIVIIYKPYRPLGLHAPKHVRAGGGRAGGHDPALGAAGH